MRTAAAASTSRLLRATPTLLVGVGVYGSSSVRYAGGIGLHPFGKMTPWQGFVSPDVDCREANIQSSGRTRRGLFAKHDMHFDKVVMKFPAVTYYVSDEDFPLQCKEMTRWVLAKMASEIDKPEKPFTQYVNMRLMNLQKGQHVVFTNEDEVFRFLAEIPNGIKLVKTETLTTRDVHNLAMQIEMNRLPMVYEDRKGVALFPEASMFNHTCDPNIELTFNMNVNKEYVVEARVLRPVKKGDQLFVSYMPGNDLPLSRLALAMRERWGFECTCPDCKSRVLSAMMFIAVFYAMPIFAPIYYFTTERQTANARRAGFL